MSTLILKEYAAVQQAATKKPVTHVYQLTNAASSPSKIFLGYRFSNARWALTIGLNLTQQCQHLILDHRSLAESESPNRLQR